MEGIANSLDAVWEVLKRRVIEEKKSRLSGAKEQINKLARRLDAEGNSDAPDFTEYFPEKKLLADIIAEYDGLVAQVDAAPDLRPKFPPVLRGVLGVNSLTLCGHFVHDPSLQEFHRCQVPQS